MTDILFHHYPPSPVAEKVRKAFGLKGLSWASVEENRLPPRPELFAMTGGFRRIPVLQIGADLYCDSQCILRALEQRFPEPTLFPNGYVGLPVAFSRFTDGELFGFAFRLALAPVADDLPADFVADRARLYIGPDGDFAKERKDLPHTLAQLRIAFGWFDDRLARNDAFLAGAQPGYADLQAWYVYWFVRGRYGDAPALLAEFTALNAWADRMDASGYGEQSSATPADALAAAAAAQPDSPIHEDPKDPLGLTPGMRVSIQPVTDSGEAPIEGALRSVERDAVALTITHPDCGETAAHFPRMGYRISVL